MKLTPFSIDSEVASSLKKYRDEGYKKGVNLTEWDMFNQHYKFGEGTTTDWTGYPISGKTVLLFNLLMLSSKAHGWRHILFTPDAGTENEVLADMVNIYTKKSFLYPPKISDDEIEKALKFIDYHFIIMKKTDIRNKVTPYEFWDVAYEISQKKEGVKSIVLDAWKDLHHDDSRYKRTDIYLEDVLSYRNKMAEVSGLHIHTVIHPTKPQRDGGGGIRPPTAYDMKGGSEWFNNAKNIVTVHRPDKNTNKVELYIRKVKPRSLGKIGMIMFYFDYYSYNYYFVNEEGLAIFLDGEIKDEYVPKKDEFEQVENDDKLPF